MSPLLLIALATAGVAAPATAIRAVAVGGAASAGASLPRGPVAIMPLTSLGSTDDSVAAIERVLHGELSKLAGDRLVTPSTLARSHRDLQTHLASCDGVLGCLVEVFGAHGWRSFIVGNIAGLGEERVINLKLIDVGAGGELRRASEKASGEEAVLIKRMRKAAVLLLAPERFVGYLEITAPQPSVQILIDGELVGTTPLVRPRLELTTGRHAVEARGDGLVPFDSMVEINYDETVPLTISLPESSVFVGGAAPFRSRWWTWTMAAAGATLAGVGGYYYVRHWQTADELSRKAGNGSLDAQDVGLRTVWQEDLLMARSLGAAGGVLLLTTGVLLVVDLL